MTLYRCPRHDLGCTDTFPTTGDLDYHLHITHGYRGFWRVAASLPPVAQLPLGPKPERRVPDGLEEGAGTPTLTEELREERDEERRGKHGGHRGRQPERRSTRR